MPLLLLLLLFGTRLCQVTVTSHCYPYAVAPKRHISPPPPHPLALAPTLTTATSPYTKPFCCVCVDVQYVCGRDEQGPGDAGAEAAQRRGKRFRKADG